MEYCTLVMKLHQWLSLYTFLSSQTLLLTVFTSVLICPTAQRENKSQLIRALHRRNQIPAQAWQTRSKSCYEPSPHILCFSPDIHLLSWFPFEFHTDLFISFTSVAEHTRHLPVHRQCEHRNAPLESNCAEEVPFKKGTKTN